VFAEIFTGSLPCKLRRDITTAMPTHPVADEIESKLCVYQVVILINLLASTRLRCAR
jgi:hypothetical protein